MRGLDNLSNSSFLLYGEWCETQAFDIIGNLSSAVLSSTVPSDLLFAFSVRYFFLLLFLRMIIFAVRNQFIKS